MAKDGVMTLHIRPFTVHNFCNHAEMFWYVSQVSWGSGVDARDVQLHALFLVWINPRFQCDEVSKFQTQNMSIVSGEIHFSITETIKNSTVQRNYGICELPELPICPVASSWIHLQRFCRVSYTGK